MSVSLLLNLSTSGKSEVPVLAYLLGLVMTKLANTTFSEKLFEVNKCIIDFIFHFNRL